MPPAGFETKFRITFVLVKAAAIALGLLGTLLSLMAVAGLMTDRLWLRLTLAIVVSLIVPLVIADRLLPSGDQRSARGLPTDVLAVVWLGCTLCFVALAAHGTRAMLAREGDRLLADGYPALARITWWMAAVRVNLPEPPAPLPAPSASASAEPSAPSSAPAASASAPVVPASDAAVEAAAPAMGKADRSPSELFRELSPSVVAIAVKRSGADAGGTGFLVAEEIVATNHHVIEGALAVQVKFMSGEKYSRIELLSDDSQQDLALLRIDFAAADAGPRPQAKSLPLGDSDAVSVGERVLSIGNPLGLEHTLTDGLVSARRVFEGRNWIQTSAPVSPGNSGGPLFDMRGEVIGVTTAQLGFFARGQNLNLAIPINTLKAMIKPSWPQRRWIGDENTAGRW